MARPASSIATRSRFVGSFMSNMEYTREVMAAGASAMSTAAAIGSTPMSRRSFKQEEHADAGEDADPGAAREGEAERHDDGRHHQRRPDPIALIEEQPRHAAADDQHQRARVGHPVRERALRPAAEVVVVEQAVLHHADEGAGGADRERDGGQRAGARAAREREHHRHEQEEHQLLGVGDAHRRIARHPGRQQRPQRVDHERPGDGRDGQRSGLTRPDQPGGDGDRQADLGRGNRQLQRRDDADERPPADALGAERAVGADAERRGRRRHDRTSSSRPAAAMTASGGIVPRQRKSPGTQRR